MMLHKITSPANPAIKMLKSLHSKKGRQETGLFLAEGARLAIEASQMDVWPDTLLLSTAALARPQCRQLAQDAAERGGRCIETSEGVLTQITKRDNAQSVVGAYKQRFARIEGIVRDAAIVIALDGVRDPGNLGTILRTADAIGAGGVALLGPHCDPYSVECVRASMGSIFAVPIAKTTFDALNVVRRARGYGLAGTSLDATEGLDAAAAEKIVLLMGNEQSGLAPDMAAACDALIKIPMRGRADSLNLAVATAVAAYDLWRRRGYDGAH